MEFNHHFKPSDQLTIAVELWDLKELGEAKELPLDFIVFREVEELKLVLWLLGVFKDPRVMLTKELHHHPRLLARGVYWLASHEHHVDTLADKGLDLFSHWKQDL